MCVCGCVCACMRACVRACVRACECARVNVAYFYITRTVCASVAWPLFVTAPEDAIEVKLITGYLWR